ncbi:hypothetical protein [Mycolicibacterium sp. GF69]|nr:hypothetical protein [Mycolicibacterium sp. GF69]
MTPAFAMSEWVDQAAVVTRQFRIESNFRDTTAKLTGEMQALKSACRQG